MPATVPAALQQTRYVKQKLRIRSSHHRYTYEVTGHSQAATVERCRAIDEWRGAGVVASCTGCECCTFLFLAAVATTLASPAAATRPCWMVGMGFSLNRACTSLKAAAYFDAKSAKWSHERHHIQPGGTQTRQDTIKLSI
jgi:hypothetical protein